MGRTFGVIAAVLLTVAAPGAALAQTGSFNLSYTTFNDGINAPVTVNAVLTATADPFATNGYLVQTITGTRGTQAITGLADPFSEFYLPATVLPGYQFATFLDTFGITFSAGGSNYEIYRNPDDSSFYHELQNPYGIGVGRLIRPAAFSIAPAATAVPEPATWGMTLFGTGLLGWALRRRRVGTRKPVRA